MHPTIKLNLPSINTPATTRNFPHLDEAAEFMPNQSPAVLEQGSRSSSARKRKLKAQNRRAITPEDNTTAGKQQQSISELFTASQQKSALRTPSSIELSPNTKRQKLGHNSSSPQMPMQASGVKTLTADEMYSFLGPNHGASANNAIDLTDTSTSASPRRMSRLTQVRLSFDPATGAKKLVVRNLKPSTRSDPAQYLNSTWAKLEAALDVIFAQADSQQSYTFSMNDLYHSVENVCKQGSAAELYTRLEEKSKQYGAGALKATVTTALGTGDAELLRTFMAVWERWERQLATVIHIFYYLERAYLLQTRQPLLRDKGVVWFRSHIFEDADIKPALIRSTLNCIAANRAGATDGTFLIEKIVKLFQLISVYTKHFEPQFLELTQNFVHEWAARKINELSLADYIIQANALIAEELRRSDTLCLESSTKRDLTAVLDHNLISSKESQLSNTNEIAELLKTNNVTGLRDLYALLQRKGSGKKLKVPFEIWVESTGTSVVFDEKDQDLMVVKLLALKKQLDNTWHEAFKRDEEIGLALREAFEKFMNKTQKSSGTWNTENSKTGEMIAKYVDMLLRGGSKAIPTHVSAVKASVDEDMDGEGGDVDEDTVVKDQLDQVLDLFRFVQGKAVFEAFYKKDLARRLLMNRSASDEAERSMLQRLKTECGAGFTQNLEQMFRDCELAREEMKSYLNLMEQRGQKSPVDLNVNVLSAAAWPTYSDVPINIPVNIKAAIDRYEEHYKSKHKGRKLEWKHALAHCQIKANFLSGRKELVVSSFQAIVLLLFNNVKSDEHITYEQLKAETGLPPAELNRTLQSLACATLRPLSKHPKGRDINPTDTFTLNADFKHPRYRVKINQVQLKETPQENKDTHERVAVERTFETQAAIVRIMKSRKTITHNELVAEVITATKSRGVLPVVDIKKNIDRLIDKDYMEREDDGTYSYVA